METFDHESIQDRQSLRGCLNSLIEGIEQGRIVFSSATDMMILLPADMIRLSIKTRKKPGASKMSIKLVWNDSIQKPLPERRSSIRISS
jgi:amphi-Trp domain-containing protein